MDKCTSSDSYVLAAMNKGNVSIEENPSINTIIESEL